MKLFKKIVIVLVVAILVLLTLFILYFNHTYTLNIFKDNNGKHSNDNKYNKYNKDNVQIVPTNKLKTKEMVGYLTIEKINIYNEVIKEGTQDNILKNNIGHFSNTSRFNGNVCIAAHNYGIRNSNLFKDLDKLKIGDIITYKTDYGQKKYKVSKITEIKSTDFSVLDNTNENIITLITCIKTRKDIRLCVKANELKEE